MPVSTQPADAVILNDPNGLGGASDTALAAVMQEALDAWVPHLMGIGTLTVQVNVVDLGQSGPLANGSPTLDDAIGDEDGKLLDQSGALFELANGAHLRGGASDITVNVNSSTLGQLYLGGDGQVPSGEYDGLSLMEHEIAHGLGFGGFTSPSGTLSGGLETAWDHYLANIGGTEVFTGPNATAVNGGMAVNVTTLGNGRGYSSIANTPSDPNALDLMSGLGQPMGVVRTISDVDLAILADTGAPITGIAGSITVGGTGVLGGPAGSMVSLGSVTLADTGALTSSLLTLTIAAGNGTAQATQAGSATEAASPDGHTLTLTGSLADVRAELASATYTSSVNGTQAVTLSVVDSFGNAGSGSLDITTTPSGYNTPTVLSVSATGDTAGPLAVGHHATFTLAISGPVSVGDQGSVSLALDDGGTALYDAADSTATSLAFIGTVASGQLDANLGVTGLALAGGASIANINGTDAALSVGILTSGASTGLAVDGVPPGAPVFTAPGAGVVTGRNTPTLAGSAQAGSTVIVTDDAGGTGSVLGTALADGVGQWTLAAPALADGVHVLTATAADDLGNVSAPSATLSFDVDTVAPAAPTLATEGDGTTALPRPTLSGTAEAGSAVTLFDGAAAIGTAQASATGSWSVAPEIALSAGENVLTATATDAAGNVSAASTPLDLILDVPAPPATPVPVPTPVPFSLDGGQSQSGTYIADQGSHFAILTAGTASIVGNASSGSSITMFASAGTLSFANGGGAGLVVGTGSPVLDMTGGLSGSTLLAFTGTGATRYAGGSGVDEIISGGGPMSLAGGTGGSLLVFGGAGPLTFTGGGESDVIIGGLGAETIHAGVGAVFGGAGGSVMVANGAGTFLAGNVDGDRLATSGVGGDILGGGIGNETLTGAGAANGDLIFAGSGADAVSLGLGADTFAGGLGSDTIQAGAGDATLYLGTGGASVISFTAGATGGTDAIFGFRVGTDHLALNGYARPATVASADSGMVVGLSDGTRIILQGVSSGNAGSLLS